MKSMIIISCCLFAASVSDQQRAPEDVSTIPLWRDRAPGATGDRDIDIPMITVYLPSASQKPMPAVVICPGGGYVRLAADHEGKVIAEWLREKGIAAFVLKYRLPVNGYRHPIPLLDARRAIQQVRFRAEEWNIDPDRIGIMGFSAGGHLASTSGTHLGAFFFDPVEPGQIDAVSEISFRPDFMVLVYPVISMQDEITHKGSKNNLLGTNPPAELVNRLSNESQITKETPPTFLVHANDDKSVLPENSIRFYEGLRKAGVPAEMHIYLKGGHGFGTRPSAGPAAKWLEQCFEWMKQAGIDQSPSK